MKRLITAALTMTAVALAGVSPTPAAAGDKKDDLAKFLLFSTLLVAIASSNNSSARKPEYKKPPHVYHSNRRHFAPPRRNRPVHRAPVQARCLEDFWDGGRWVTFVDHQCRRISFGRRSLRKAEACLTNRYRHGRWDTSFDLDCMSRQGFTLANRR